MKSFQSQRQHEFQQVNSRIYRYKQELEKKNNPFQNFRLQNALKTSRVMADQLEKQERQIKTLEQRLQFLYQTAVQEIDREIQKYLLVKKKAVIKKKSSSLGFETIQELEKEKADYYNRLKTIKVIDAEWKNLHVEPGDTPQRIQMKMAILQDKLANLERTIRQQKARLEELKKDRKVYREMLSFYTDLKLAIDDEQEFFDRNRVDELQDRVDGIDTKIRELEQHINETGADADTLKNKIKIFR
ncbi:MAG: hypothetical protein GWP06_07620, partial [Actinobacteria bacterium]|nr:hypothetical protein [Actinomycetota bacterium]